MREEPVIYINGKPFEVKRPYKICASIQLVFLLFPQWQFLAFLLINMLIHVHILISSRTLTFCIRVVIQSSMLYYDYLEFVRMLQSCAYKKIPLFLIFPILMLDINFFKIANNRICFGDVRNRTRE